MPVVVFKTKRRQQTPTRMMSPSPAVSAPAQALERFHEFLLLVAEIDAVILKTSTISLSICLLSGI